MSQKQKICLAFSLIILLAIFFRFWQIDKVPLGLYPDEAINANDAITNPGKVFYPENNGREGLFINLVYLFFSLFGISITTLRIVPAIFGSLTVLGTFLLTKELFFNHQKRDLIALLSSFFLAVSFWHINFSRIAFRAILLPFCLVFSFYFLLRARRVLGQNKKTGLLFAAVGGIFYGLGFYTYIPMRLSPLIFLAFIFLMINKEQRSSLIKLVAVFLFVTFIIALPIGIYFINYPQNFISRAQGVSIFSTQNPIKSFIHSLFIHLGMFVFRGDQNWRHNHPQKTEVLPLLGILLYIALIFGFIKLIKDLKEKNWNESFLFSFLFLWFFALILGGALTYEGIPHALRTIGIVPVVYIFIGWIVTEIFLFLKKYQKEKLGWAIVGAILIYSLTLNFYWYFIRWAKDPNMPGAFTYNFVKIGEYINKLPDSVNKYVIVNEAGVPVPYPDGIPMPAQTIMFMERSKYHKLRAIYLKPEEINQIKKGSIAVLMKYDENILNQLKSKFPKGHSQTKNSITTFILPN